ncbi:MAG TPA: CBS domain-containing protein [Candidatus Acidoferrum sp.]|nr:CBS domain-containing protein [Candidatus Acidoferrum sp.]
MVYVKEYMSSPVIFLERENTVENALTILKQTGHTGFPILENDTLVGIVTIADFIDVKLTERLDSIMTKNPVSASPDDDIVSVAGVMAYNHIHHMLIVSEGKVVGIVTGTDMLRAIVENIISENVEKIFTFFQRLHPNVKVGHARVLVSQLIPTQKLLEASELQRRNEEFKRGVIYSIVVAKRGKQVYIIDGHHRAYLAYKQGIKEIPAFFIEGEVGITKSSQKLGLQSLDDMKIMQ